MGTHPIFESDFDCLTALLEMFRISRNRLFLIKKNTRVIKRNNETEAHTNFKSRYFDEKQTVFRSQHEVKTQRTAELKTGDNKRRIPLKTLVPEEYRGARYYSDREMEFVDPYNALKRPFKGPYSAFFPHRDGRMECEGDRVPCNNSIKHSLCTNAPLLLEDGFVDQSKFGKYRRSPSRNGIINCKLYDVLSEVTDLYKYLYRNISI